MTKIKHKLSLTLNWLIPHDLQSPFTKYMGSALLNELHNLKLQYKEAGMRYHTCNDIDQLRFELDESNCLLQSSVGNKSTVRLCAVVHPTGYYYLTNVQVDTFNPKVIVNRFVNRVLDLKHSSGQKSNDKLHEFVSVNAGDLLREKGFEVCELGDFKTTEEVIKVVDNYHSKQADKICLNHVFNNH